MGSRYLSRAFRKSPAMVVLFNRQCKVASSVFGPAFTVIGGRTMSQIDMFDQPDEGCEVIYRMTIRTKSGKVIRRANGQPFRIVIRRKR